MCVYRLGFARSWKTLEFQTLPRNPGKCTLTLKMIAIDWLAIDISVRARAHIHMIHYTRWITFLPFILYHTNFWFCPVRSPSTSYQRSLDYMTWLLIFKIITSSFHFKHAHLKPWSTCKLNNCKLKGKCLTYSMISSKNLTFWITIPFPMIGNIG